MERKRRVTGPDGQLTDATEVGFRTHGEHWNEYLLDDGTVIRLPPELESCSYGDALQRLVEQWADIALSHAIVREIEDPSGLIARVVGVKGSWGFGQSAGEALAELRTALIDWASIKLKDGDDDIPSMEGVHLVINR